MNEPSESPERTATEQALEQLLTRTMREVPLQRAPATLESRILRELERRAALPWWRRSFAHWPMGARAAFAVLAVVLVTWVFRGVIWAGDVLSSLHDSGALSMPWVQRATALAGAAGQLAASLTRAVPSQWVFDGVAASAALYAALFGLAIAAYRMLYLNPPPVTGDRP
jgi:hypothetical protein